MKTKTTSQRIRDTARILQAAGITLARGDAARVEGRLQGQPIKPALAVAAAGALGLKPRSKRESLEKIRSDALGAIAHALLARTSATEASVGALFRTLAAWIDQDPPDPASVQLIRMSEEHRFVDVLARLHQRGRETSLYAIAEGQACRDLLASLEVHAEDIVLGMDEASIDALATIPTYEQAARLIEKKLIAGGSRDSLAFRYLTAQYTLLTRHFILDHLGPVQTPKPAHTAIQNGALHPQIRESAAAIAGE